MLRENATIVVAKNEFWRGTVATEPVECGWAEEAIFFIRMLGGAAVAADAVVEISPDGMHWTAAGVAGALPSDADTITALRVRHFGNWLRLTTTIPDEGEFVALVTLHLK